MPLSADPVSALVSGQGFLSGFPRLMCVDDFVRFTSWAEDKRAKEAQAFWFAVVDADCDGRIGRQDTLWCWQQARSRRSGQQLPSRVPGLGGFPRRQLSAGLSASPPVVSPRLTARRVRPVRQIEAKESVAPGALVRFDDLFLQARPPGHTLSARPLRPAPPSHPALPPRNPPGVRHGGRGAVRGAVPRAAEGPEAGVRGSQPGAEKGIITADLRAGGGIGGSCFSPVVRCFERGRRVAPAQLCNHNDLMARRTTAEFSAKGLEVPL